MICRHALVAALLAAITLSCTGADGAAGVSDSTFVVTVSDLRRLNSRAGLDSARRSAMRDSIMRRHRVTPDQLERAARRLARDPQRAQDVWNRIERRQRDTTRTR